MIGRIAAKALGSIDESVLQVGAGGSALIHAVYIVNSTASLKRIRLHHCRAGEASSLGNALLWDAAIAPNSSLVEDSRFALGPGDELRAKASDSGISILVEGHSLP